jgi:hypothetical protein
MRGGAKGSGGGGGAQPRIRPSGGAPALRGDPYHPASVAARIRPRYEINPAHLPGRNPNKTPIPADAEAVYQTAVRGRMGTWYGRGQQGWYRYFHNNVDAVHFSGIIREHDVPVDIVRGLR